MKIISNREYELTDAEARAQAHYEGMLSRGYTVPVSAARVQETHPGLDPAFYRLLRGEELVPKGEAPGLYWDRDAHRQWHRDTWAFAQDTLRETFQQNGFEVHINVLEGTLTVIERSTNKALTITPITNTMKGVRTGAEAL